MLLRSPLLLRHAATSTRSGLVVASGSLLDQIGCLDAVGLQGLIQATRDAGQNAFSTFQPIVIDVAIGALLCVAITAWREGRRFRAASSGAQLTERDFVLLVLCFGLDLVGGSSFVTGEFADAVWAPVSAIALNALFGSASLAFLNFFKEALPFTDVLPVATLGWLLAYAYPDSTAARVLGLDSWLESEARNMPSDGVFDPDGE